MKIIFNRISIPYSRDWNGSIARSGPWTRYWSTNQHWSESWSNFFQFSGNWSLENWSMT